MAASPPRCCPRSRTGTDSPCWGRTAPRTGLPAEERRRAGRRACSAGVGRCAGGPAACCSVQTGQGIGSVRRAHMAADCFLGRSPFAASTQPGRLLPGTSTAARCSHKSTRLGVIGSKRALEGPGAHLHCERLDNAPPPAQVVREHVVHGAQRHGCPLSRSKPRAGPQQTPQLPVQKRAGSLALAVPKGCAARCGEAQGKSAGAWQKRVRGTMSARVKPK